MSMFSQWGDVYASDQSYKELKPGDKIKIKPSVPLTGGLYGQLEKIDTDGSYIVNLENGVRMGYDGDMLIKIKARS